MGDDNTVTKGLRAPWFSFAAMFAAALAVLGINPTSDKAPTETKVPSTAASPMPSGLVSFPQRIWDDPFEQLATAQKLLEQSSQASSTNGSPIQIGPNGQLDALQEILLERVFEKKIGDIASTPTTQDTKLLVILNLVPGKLNNDDTQFRLSSRHVQEIAFSLYGFRPVLPDRLSFIKLPSVETYFSVQHHVTYAPAVPIKLYENSSTKQFILNIWFDQDMLGQKPWHCMQSVIKSLCSSEKHSKVINSHLMPCSSLAISGPNTSDILKVMQPTIMVENRGYFLDPSSWPVDNPPGPSSPMINSSSQSDTGLFSSWKDLHWQINQCSVPLETLWPSLFESPKKMSDEAKQEFGEVKFIPIKVHVSIPDDRELVSVLADELETRLGDFAGTNRQIMLFVEQDREYGRYLGKELRKQLLRNSSFRFANVPYLRDIGTASMSSNATDVTTPQSNVNDYFKRTLDSLDATSSEFRKPAAIGILGGSWQDKIALIREVRHRFPQSLCFTNDFDSRFADPRLLPITRNLLIASHGDPMPRIKSAQGDIASISFRTEYQATDLIGFANLFEKVFRFKENQKESSFQSDVGTNSPFVEPEGCSQARVYEVTNSGFVSMPLREEENSDVNPWRAIAAPILGSLSVVLLLCFPLLHTLLQEQFDSYLNKGSHDKWRRYFIENWGDISKMVLRNLSSTAAFLVTATLCILPAATLQECTSASIAHWAAGISIVPSILILAFTIPFTFRPTQKSDQYSSDNTKRIASRDEERASGREEQLKLFEAQVHELGRTINMNALPTDVRSDTSSPIRRPYKLGIVIGVLVSCTGFFTWYWTNDAWIFQIGLLGFLAFCVKMRRTMSQAVFTTLLIGLCIGWARYLANDYEVVPARDAWLRTVGFTCFSVAYWWLLVGLVKLTLYQRRLRTQLRMAGQWMERLQVEHCTITLKTACTLDTTIVETGKVSKSISQDLSLLAGIGLVVCFARIPFLDAWGMSYATWLTIVLPMAIPFLFAVILRRRAWRFRDSVLQYMLRSKRKESTADLRKEEIDEINERQALIKNFDSGVFASLDRDPLVSAGIALLLALCSGPNSDIIRRILSFVVL